MVTATLPVKRSQAVAVFDLMRDPEYVKLLGEGMVIGAGVGALAKISPQLAVGAAFVAGAYYAIEIMAWIEKSSLLQAEPAVLDVIAVDVDVLQDAEIES